MTVFGVLILMTKIMFFFVIHAGKSEMYTIDKESLTDTGADYIRKVLDEYISNKKQ